MSQNLASFEIVFFVFHFVIHYSLFIILNSGSPPPSLKIGQLGHKSENEEVENVKKGQNVKLI